MVFLFRFRVLCSIFSIEFLTLKFSHNYGICTIGYIIHHHTTNYPSTRYSIAFPLAICYDRRGSSSRENFNSLRLFHERFFVRPFLFFLHILLRYYVPVRLPACLTDTFSIILHHRLFFIICLSFSIHSWFRLNSSLAQIAITTARLPA